MKILSAFFFALFLLLPHTAQAQLTITPLQELNFGEFITRNPMTLVSRVTVSPNGNTTSNANTIILVPGQNAEFELTGGPANTAFNVTIDVIDPPGYGGVAGTPVFRLDNFQVRPNTLQTNGAGVDTFRIGARLRTITGNSYPDGTYIGQYEFTVEF